MCNECPAMIAEITALREQNARMREALGLWIKYDTSDDERENAGTLMMLEYDDALTATRAALNPEK